MQRNLRAMGRAALQGQGQAYRRQSIRDAHRGTPRHTNAHQHAPAVTAQDCARPSYRAKTFGAYAGPELLTLSVAHAALEYAALTATQQHRNTAMRPCGIGQALWRHGVGADRAHRHPSQTPHAYRLGPGIKKPTGTLHQWVCGMPACRAQSPASAGNAQIFCEDMKVS
jgi:hypothetical protein